MSASQRQRPESSGSCLVTGLLVLLTTGGIALITAAALRARRR